MRLSASLSAVVFSAAASAFAAAAAPPKAAPAEPVQGYKVDRLADDIAVTPATAMTPGAEVKVVDQPRKATGHPCTLWDKEDVARFREQLKTDKKLQADVANLQKAMDARMAKPLGVPEVSSEPPTRDAYHVHAANAVTMTNLGLMYALTGDEKYAEYCRKMLLAYGENYTKYSHPANWTKKSYRSALDGRLTGQFLEDGFWLIRVAFAYDLVHDASSWTEADRKTMHDGLFEPIAEEFYDPVEAPTTYVNGTHNRAALCTNGVLLAGYACDDEKLVNIATYGVGGTADHPTGGIFGTFFTDRCICDDGLWNEGAPGYQLGIASSGLINDAETLWRHGVDLYSYRGGVLKRLLDSALALAYPDDKLTVAALHDSGQAALIGDKDWWTNEAGIPYEYGYQHYRDPNYLPIVRNAAQTVEMTVHAGGPSAFGELPATETAPPRKLENANFYSVGYGVLRQQTPKGPIQLIMEYGPSGGHAHPSKLGIDLYALGESLVPFPGVIFPYQDPMDPKWYWTTLANCGVTVDQTSQIYSANRWHYPKDLPDPRAEELVYAPGDQIGMERAWSASVYPGVTQDRSLFLTPDYLVDLFGNFSNTSHQYDFAWHFRGKLDSSLPLQPMEFKDPAVNGYNGLTDVRHAAGDQPWSINIATPTNQTARLFATGAEGGEVITGDGHFFIGTVKNDEHPPTVIERRTSQTSTIFANALDISGGSEPFIKAITQTGGLADGYTLATIQTTRGNDLCFAAFQPGDHTAGDLKTDAQQAMVRMNQGKVTAMYLAGGKSLHVPGGSLERSEPGLACVTLGDNGQLTVGNPSPSDASITVDVGSIKKTVQLKAGATMEIGN